MKFYRIKGVILRYIYFFRHSLDRMSDAFYWPTIDLLLWGLTSRFFMTQGDAGIPIITIILSGVVYWIIVWRGQYEITTGLLEDLWNHNLVNIFASPLKFSEWVVSLLLIGIGKAVISFTFAVGVAYLLYKTNLFVYGFHILPFAVLLIMFGWAIGLFVAAIIMRYGTRLQTLAWTAIYIASPFSAIYYPLSVLPSWAQKVASLIPTSYVFEGLRTLLATGTLDYTKLIPSFVLNVIYLALSFLFLRSSFRKVLNRGLVSLY